MSFPLWGIFFGIVSNYSIKISALHVQILSDFIFMPVMHGIHIYDKWNEMVIRLSHSCISDL